MAAVHEADRTASASWQDTRDITALLFSAARLLDDGAYLAYVDLFAEDGTYMAIPLQNYSRGLPLALIADDHDRMLDRHEMIEKYWSLEPTQTRHLVTNIEISMDRADAARVGSTFVVYVTGPRGVPEVQGLGRYEDDVVDRGDGWRFRRRVAVFDNHLITHAISCPF